MTPYVLLTVLLTSFIFLRFMRIYNQADQMHDLEETTHTLTFFFQIDQNRSKFAYHSSFYTIGFPGGVQAKIGDTIIVRGTVSRTHNTLTDLVNSKIRLIGKSYVIKQKREDSGIFYVWYFLEKVANIRRNFLEFYRTRLPPNHASLATGMLIGSDTAFSPDFLDSARKTGILHVVSASGYNVSVILSSLQYILIKQGKMKYLLIGIGTLLYTTLAGFSVSVLRAAIMALVGLLAITRGREYHGGWILVLTSLIFLAVNPLLLFSVSFQLSFGATAGILFLMPILQRKIRETFASKTMRFLCDQGLISFCAMMGTLPFLVLSFGQISLVGLLANPLLLWTVPYIMGVSFFSFLSAKIPLLSDLSIQITYLSTNFFIQSVRFFAGFPLASLFISPHERLIIGLWGAGICGIIASERIRKKKYIERKELLSRSGNS